MVVYDSIFIIFEFEKEYTGSSLFTSSPNYFYRVSVCISHFYTHIYKYLDIECQYLKLCSIIVEFNSLHV